MIKKNFYIILIGLLIQSCSYFKSKQDVNRKLIAKVYDVYLYEDEIKSILPKKITKEDSVLLVTNFINSWAKQQLLYKKAKLNLKEEQNEIERLVNKYEQDLLIHKYKEAVILQDLDTIISNDEIEQIYIENKEIFKINEKLIMFKFLQLEHSNKNYNKISSLFKLESNRKNIEVLKKYGIEFKSFHLNDSVWIKMNDVLKILPLLKGFEHKIVKNKYLEINNEIDTYFIQIKDVIDRNQLAPKNYVEPTIKEMILHNRKLILLKKIEKTLLNDATKNGNYEIYK